jgi:N utilization substance protein B
MDAQQENTQAVGGTSSQTAKALSARLFAVQGVYQFLLNQTSMRTVLAQYLEDAEDAEVEGEKLVTPDGRLLKKILLGVDGRLNDLGDILSHHYKKNREGETVQPEILLKSILLCGAYEILAHDDIDAPIIINDYLNVAHGFYEKGEVSLINGILDSVSKALRS